MHLHQGELEDEQFLLAQTDILIEKDASGKPIKLGQGAFGTVYKALLWGYVPVACKEIRLSNRHQYEDVKAEALLLK